MSLGQKGGRGRRSLHLSRAPMLALVQTDATTGEILSAGGGLRNRERCRVETRSTH